MIPKTLTLALLSAIATADTLKPVTPPAPPTLEKRQLSCGIAQEDCGTGCIPLGWTCCPDGSGGCGILETCVLGTNDEYGCCPVGRRCVGEGGVTSIGGDRGGGGSRPTPTFDDDDDLFPEPTSTGSSLGGDDDDDDLDFGDDDDDDLDFGGDDDDDLDFTTTTTSERPTQTFSPGGGAGGDDDDDDDFDVAAGGDDEGDDEGSAARNALSFVGAIAAAVLAL